MKDTELKEDNKPSRSPGLGSKSLVRKPALSSSVY